MHEQDVGRVIYRALDMLNARAVREFRVPPSTYIGPGATVRAGEACAALGIRRLFVMVDGRLHEQALDQGLLRSLDDAGLGCECLVYAGGEPHSEVVEAAGHQNRAAPARLQRRDQCPRAVHRHDPLGEALRDGAFVQFRQQADPLA